MSPGAHPCEHTPHPDATSAQLSHADTHTGQIPVTQPTPDTGTHTSPRADLLCTQTRHADKTRPPQPSRTHITSNTSISPCAPTQTAACITTRPHHTAPGALPQTLRALSCLESPPLLLQAGLGGSIPEFCGHGMGSSHPGKAVTLSPPHIEVPAVQ